MGGVGLPAVQNDHEEQDQQQQQNWEQHIPFDQQQRQEMSFMEQHEEGEVWEDPSEGQGLSSLQPVRSSAEGMYPGQGFQDQGVGQFGQFGGLEEEEEGLLAGLEGGGWQEQGQPLPPNGPSPQQQQGYALGNGGVSRRLSMPPAGAWAGDEVPTGDDHGAEYWGGYNEIPGHQYGNELGPLGMPAHESYGDGAFAEEGLDGVGGGGGAAYGSFGGDGPRPHNRGGGLSPGLRPGSGHRGSGHDYVEGLSRAGGRGIYGGGQQGEEWREELRARKEELRALIRKCIHISGGTCELGRVGGQLSPSLKAAKVREGLLLRRKDLVLSNGWPIWRPASALGHTIM